MTDPITTPAQMREAAARLVDEFASLTPAEIKSMSDDNRLFHSRAVANSLLVHEIATAIRALPVAEPEPLAVTIKPLSDEDRDWIDARADELFRANERARGGVRNQTITPQDFRDYFVVTATRERVLSQIEAVSVAQVRAEALEEAAALPPYDCDGDPAGSFDHHVFVKRDAIRALMEREPT